MSLHVFYHYNSTVQAVGCTVCISEALISVLNASNVVSDYSMLVTISECHCVQTASLYSWEQRIRFRIGGNATEIRTTSLRNASL
jgi:hypothetical protein